MINDIVEKVEHRIGKSLYADDGAFRTSERNLEYLKRKMLAAIDRAEEWGQMGIQIFNIKAPGHMFNLIMFDLMYQWNYMEKSLNKLNSAWWKV